VQRPHDLVGDEQPQSRPAEPLRREEQAEGLLPGLLK